MFGKYSIDYSARSTAKAARRTGGQIWAHATCNMRQDQSRHAWTSRWNRNGWVCRWQDQRRSAWMGRLCVGRFRFRIEANLSQLSPVEFNLGLAIPGAQNLRSRGRSSRLRDRQVSVIHFIRSQAFVSSCAVLISFGGEIGTSSIGTFFFWIARMVRSRSRLLIWGLFVSCNPAR